MAKAGSTTKGSKGAKVKGLGYRQAQRLRKSNLELARIADEKWKLAIKEAARAEGEKARADGLQKQVNETASNLGSAWKATEQRLGRVERGARNVSRLLTSLSALTEGASAYVSGNPYVTQLVLEAIHHRVQQCGVFLDDTVNPPPAVAAKGLQYLVLWRGTMDDVPLLLTGDLAEAEALMKRVTLEDAQRIAGKVFSIDISTGCNVSIVTLKDGVPQECCVARDLSGGGDDAPAQADGVKSTNYALEVGSAKG